MTSHEASFRFECSYAEKLYEVLSPESVSDPGERSSVQLAYDETSLTLVINAEDTSALRAALNMWLRLVNVSKEVLEM